MHYFLIVANVSHDDKIQPILQCKSSITPASFIHLYSISTYFYRLKIDSVKNSPGDVSVPEAGHMNVSINVRKDVTCAIWQL